ncbi:FAD-dependent oxidoreductase [Agromyces laixinhei]|uniref:FAD-dependent oxidoreductase n=1 Tax=Agromyces laixinhei TaxID=2585717 RepID=UPI0012EE3FD3|nr:FAD-dependent oxidoreductase [Agromyces laixinhei]
MTEPTAPDADLLIIGGGLGGVAAALAALRRGRAVILTEETDWLGGQLTSQGVPPDEHPWIEQFGSTRSYRRLRDEIREHYRRWYPLTNTARTDPVLNPGLGKVSKLCHEPAVAASVIDALIAPFVASGRLRVLRESVPVAAESIDGVVRSVTIRDGTGATRALSAPFVLDATELGDLLPLAGVPYVTGFESRMQTGEPSAPETAQPDNVQAFSWVFAMGYDEHGDHTIERPVDYDYWRSYEPDFWHGPLLGLIAPDPRTLEPLERSFLPNAPVEGTVSADQSKDPGDRELWAFRRVLARATFEPGFLESDVTVVNWPMIDYLDGNLIDATSDARERHLEGSRSLSRSMLYWLQTEAPRGDGGRGWPGLHLRGDVLGTDDGLAKAPYIREGRRIRARYTVTEQDLSLAIRGDRGAVDYPDSVGIGMYRIDLHPSTGGDNYIDVASSPFQIPLGALIPERGGNLIAAGKNIGTTHITNGCYRLHPVEWNIGEAAGALAAFCLENDREPDEVHADSSLLRAFQTELELDGFELRWPEVKGF